MSLHRLKKSDTLPAVGRDVDTWCNKCGAELAHIILAMVGNLPAKVKCKTCGSEHKYKLSKAEATAKRRTAAKTGTRATRTTRATQRKPEATLARERFERMVADRDPDSASAYSPRLQVEKQQLIQHSKFGLGVVDTIMGTKAVVVFSEGPRTLVVNR